VSINLYGEELSLLLESRQQNVSYDIGRLCGVIYEIIDLHKEYAQQDINNYNLRKTLVNHILEQVDDTDTYIINKDFHTTLNKYLSHVDRLTIESELEYTYSDLDCRVRVKQQESIIYKIGHYHSGKAESGKLPLNKCLNDLVGFRVVLPDFNHTCQSFEEMCSYIGKNYRIKYRNSSKGEYKATHVYFYGAGNMNFPWELQIWLPEDHANNYESHNKHKQGYKESAKIHKESFTF
jgi:hypothetical protein